MHYNDPYRTYPSLDLEDGKAKVLNYSVSDLGGSTYDADKTVLSAASTREAIATGARSVWIRNNGATNFMRFRFGDSTIDATLTTGFRLNLNESIKLVIPDGATHWAYIADTANVTASVVWS